MDGRLVEVRSQRAEAQVRCDAFKKSGLSHEHLQPVTWRGSARQLPWHMPKPLQRLPFLHHVADFLWCKWETCVTTLETVTGRVTLIGSVIEPSHRQALIGLAQPRLPRLDRCFVFLVSYSPHSLEIHTSHRYAYQEEWRRIPRFDFLYGDQSKN